MIEAWIFKGFKFFPLEINHYPHPLKSDAKIQNIGVVSSLKMSSHLTKFVNTVDSRYLEVKGTL